jgi:Mrp family chromosome partitioning ATPase
MTGGALLVTRVGSTKTDQLDGAVQALGAVGANVLGVVANRVRKKKKAAYGSYYTAQPSGWRHRSVFKGPIEDTQTILRSQ